MYKKTSQPSQVNLSEILEALRVLGITVMEENFDLEMGPQHTQGNNQAITQDNPFTEDPTRPFACTQCPKRFRLKHNLKPHMLIHSGEKPFSCNLCSERFNRSYTLKKHMKVHSAGRVSNKFQDDPSSSLSSHDEHGREVDGSPDNFINPPAPGMVFPNFEELAAYVYNWGRVNSSLLVTGGFQRKSLQHRGFHCPHKMSNWKLKKRGSGKKKSEEMLQYADCPFAIRIKGRQADGSYVITKADLEHKGHEVSVDHFQKHSKRGGISYRGVLKSMMGQVENFKMSKGTQLPKSDSRGKEEEEEKIEVNNGQGEALVLPLAYGVNHAEHSNITNSTYDVDKEENMDANENTMLLNVSSTLEDEICLDEMPQEKKKPKKVITTKDRHNFFNFFTMKEKEKKELEEKEKSKKVKSKEEEQKEREKRIAAEKLKDVFRLIW